MCTPRTPDAIGNPLDPVSLCVDRSGRPAAASHHLEMHQNLRAWRLKKGLTLEEVAASIGRKHPTISRWERGKLPLTTRDLERLAEIYGVTSRQLCAPPSQASLVAHLDDVQQIIEGMDEGDLGHWLATGRAMRRKHAA